MDLKKLGSLVVGGDTEVPLLNGEKRVYVNFDNAASTPPLIPVQEKVNEFCRWYSNVHRGTGFKSMLSSWVFDRTRKIVADFLGCGREKSIIYCKNTTEALNKIAGRIRESNRAGKKPVILTTVMEHHSNDLPWRKAGEVVHVKVDREGKIDRQDFDSKLDKHADRVQLVAVNGASNVTGYINPIHEFAGKAHEVGAKIVVDAAQLIPHRPVDIKPEGHPEHLDFLAFSAHKVYAPYGIGVLVADRDLFETREPPEYVGGGTIDLVGLDKVFWKGLPEREEAGTPDVVGTVALAEAFRLIDEVGFDSIIEHETELTRYALEKLNSLDGLKIYGDINPDNAEDRLGVISFNLKEISHAKVASILSYEGGIGVRNGCFCAHPYVKDLLNLGKRERDKLVESVLNEDRSDFPGTVRISFGLYNRIEEIDRLLEMLENILEDRYEGDYKIDRKSGEYHPVGFEYDYKSFFEV